MPKELTDYINKNLIFTGDRQHFNDLLKNFESISINKDNHSINIEGWVFSKEVLLDIYEEYQDYVKTMKKFIDFFEINDLDRKMKQIQFRQSKEIWHRRDQEKELLDKKLTEESQKLPSMKIVNLQKENLQ